MIIQFIPKPHTTVPPAHDNGHTRKRATVYSIFTPTKAPDGTVRYSNSGYKARTFGSPDYHGRPDPWDGGDAA